MSSSADSHHPFTLRVQPDGIVRLTWPDGVRITGALAREAVAAVDTLNAGQERRLLVDMTGTAALSREARVAFTQKCSANAVALLGRSPVDRVIANFALGVSPQQAPTRFFTSDSLAVKWLHDVEPRP